jgi:RNA polymerase sigma-70 factor (ECF subfamily)
LPRDSQEILLELLVLRCKRGEGRAFEELIRQYEKRLFYFLRRLVATEEDAWDALQQTWLRVFRGIRTLESPDRLPVWLYRVARCAALDHRRQRDRRTIPLDDQAELSELAAETDPGDFEAREHLHAALSRISLSHREVLTLHFLESFSVEQLAEILAIPPGTVKSRLFHARRALRTALERGEENP